MTYRPYERLPAREFALRFERTNRKLRAECGIEASNDNWVQPARFNPAILILTFLGGGAFWLGLGAYLMN